MTNDELPKILGIHITAPFTFVSIAIFLVIVVALPLGNLWQTKARKAPKETKIVDTDCPYEYILGIYGKHHFAGLVRKLAPTMEASNPDKFKTILDVMDAVHFCLILIDDVVPSNLQA